MNNFEKKMTEIVTKLENKKWLKDLWIFLLILLVIWFLFGGDNMTKEEYRGGYGYITIINKIV